MVGIINDKGPGCIVFKKDLKRAYRQLPLDPEDLHLVGFQWNGKLFSDRVLPMGLRSQICQRVATAVSYLYYKLGYMAVHYLDDFRGAELLGKILENCGLKE